jgi:hypothetical protein
MRRNKVVQVKPARVLVAKLHPAYFRVVDATFTAHTFSIIAINRCGEPSAIANSGKCSQRATNVSSPLIGSPSTDLRRMRVSSA